MDILENSSRWLESQRHKHRTRSVVYRRGESSVVLPATVGRTQFERGDEYGTIIESEMRDYLCRAEDLVIDGVPVLPERGDQIEETAGDTTFAYEVMPLAGEQPWRYSDPYRQTLRIHTRQVGEA
jgi:hypothetical protein